MDTNEALTAMARWVLNHIHDYRHLPSEEALANLLAVILAGHSNFKLVVSVAGQDA